MAWTTEDQAVWSAGLQPVHATWNGDAWTPQRGTTGSAPFAPYPRPEGVQVRTALRPPRHAVMFDVDCGRDGKQGDVTLARMQHPDNLGPLPPTFKLTARGGHQNSGRFGFRIPSDLIITDTMFDRFGVDGRTGSIEVIRTGHRFSWSFGDTHPKTGTRVLCYAPDGTPIYPPSVDQWPSLPQRWVNYFREHAPTPFAQGVSQPARKISVSRARADLLKRREQVWQDTPQSGRFRSRIGTWARQTAGYMLALGHTPDASCEYLLKEIEKHPRWGTSDWNPAITEATIIDYVYRYAVTEPIELEVDFEYGGMTARQQVDAMDAGLPPPHPVSSTWGDTNPGVLGDQAALTPSAQPAAKSTRKIKLTYASDTTTKLARWLWTDTCGGRLPLGELSVVAGRGGIGKSPFTLWLAARLSRGELPGDLLGQARTTLIYATEDDWSRTVQPRLIAAGADLTRVAHIEAVVDEDGNEADFSWAQDLESLDEVMAETGAALLIIDPLINVMTKGDAHNNADVSAALKRLVDKAHKHECSIVGLVHASKATDGQLDNVINGSVAWRNVPRAALLFTQHQDTGERIISQNKNNMGRKDLPNLAFDMLSVDIPVEGKMVSHPAFVLGEITETDAADALASTRKDQGPEIQPIEALDWLADALKFGPKPVSELQKIMLAEPTEIRVWGTIANQVGSRDGRRLFHKRKPDYTGPWIWELTEAGFKTYGIRQTVPAPPTPPHPGAWQAEPVRMDGVGPDLGKHRVDNVGTSECSTYGVELHDPDVVHNGYAHSSAQSVFTGQ